MKNHLSSAETIIIYEDDDLIVVNKPFGVASLHERIGTKNSVIEILTEYCPTVQLCHRLDRDTSGVMLVAKNPETYRLISMEFERRNISKCYTAVVHGRHQFDGLEINLPLSVSSKGKAKIDYRQGKPAKTTVSSIEYFKHFTVLHCFPESGRLHQIRIHLSAQNAPIVADPQYGGELPFLSNLVSKYQKGRDKEARPMIQRVALHASSIKFSINDKPYEFTAPLSDDIEVLLKLLRRNDKL